MRRVWDTYKGYEVGTRHLQGVRGSYKIPTKGMKRVWNSYKGYEVGTRHLHGV